MSAVAAGALLLVLVLLVSIGGGLVLYALVRAERDRREVVSREEATRLARRDTDDEERDGRPP